MPAPNLSTVIPTRASTGYLATAVENYSDGAANESALVRITAALSRGRQ